MSFNKDGISGFIGKLLLYVSVVRDLPTQNRGADQDPVPVRPRLTRPLKVGPASLVPAQGRPPLGKAVHDPVRIHVRLHHAHLVRAARVLDRLRLARRKKAFPEEDHFPALDLIEGRVVVQQRAVHDLVRDQVRVVPEVDQKCQDLGVDRGLEIDRGLAAGLGVAHEDHAAGHVGPEVAPGAVLIVGGDDLAVVAAREAG